MGGRAALLHQQGVDGVGCLRLAQLFAQACLA